MKKFVTLMFVACSLVSSAQSDTGNKKKEKVYLEPRGHGLGAIISSSSGKGLSYRYWPREYGIHAAFTPMANNDQKYYNLGVTGYKTLREFNVARIFTHIGVEYVYMHDKSVYGHGQYSDYSLKTTGWNIGGGAGLGLHFKWFAMDAFVGYGIYTRDEQIIGGNSDDEADDQTLVTFTGGLAMYFGF